LCPCFRAEEFQAMAYRWHDMPQNQAKDEAALNPGACIPGTQYARVWVGRVKSNCKPESLEVAFKQIGKLLEVETGFAGFAFVTFESESDADEAVKQFTRPLSRTSVRFLCPGQRREAMKMQYTRETSTIGQQERQVKELK